MATESNITLRSDKDRFLLFEEMDRNLLELKELIIEFNSQLIVFNAHVNGEFVDFYNEFQQYKGSVNLAFDALNEVYQMNINFGQQALANSMPTYLTLAALNVDTGQDQYTLARVVDDATLANNGYYVWDGSNWNKTKYQPLMYDDAIEIPTPNKVPKSDSSGTIEPTWVRDLAFNLDQTKAQLWNAKFPGIPAPSFYQEFGGGASILDPRITFTRASDSWYWKDGVLVKADVNGPVFENGMLRLEPSATNLVTTTMTDWSKNSATVVLDDDSLWGVTESYLIAGTSAGFTGAHKPLTTLEKDKFSIIEFLCKRSNQDEIIARIDAAVSSPVATITINFVNKTVTPSYNNVNHEHVKSDIVEMADGWFLVRWMIKKLHSGANDRFYIYSGTYGGLGQEVYVSSPLVALQSNFSSLILGGTNTTRAADNFSIVGQDFEDSFNPNEGALVLTAKMLRTALGGVGANIYLFNFLTPTGVTPYLGFGIGDNTNSLTMRSDMFSSGSHATVIPEVQVGRTYKIALAWNSENEVVAFVDGERVTSKFMQQGFMQSLTDLFIGGGRGSQYTIGSRIEAVSLYTTRPSDAQLEALTAND